MPKARKTVLRIPRIRPWRITLSGNSGKKTYSGVSYLTILYGFTCVIGIGTILLMLPISSRSGELTPFVDALFTSTSAVCVTGLVVVDTGTYWSPFGQATILALIQIGGFGFMTSATLFLLVLGRRIGLRERLLIGESMGQHGMGGVVRLIKRMAVFTLVVEALASLVFFIHFTTQEPAGTAAWKSVFQAVSAFNNAGFDIFGNFRSLLNYQSDSLVIVITAVLIFLGGISYIVIADVVRSLRWNRLSLDSKIVLTTTGILLFSGMAIVLLTEYNNAATIGPMAWPGKLLNAFFHSVTARTAGFSTIGISNLADYSLFFVILLMFIGGASGSTAGGIKVNTFGILAAAIWSSLRGREHPRAFDREFMTHHIYRALTIGILSLTFIAIVVLLLTVTEKFHFLNLLFESFSAFGTVGLSTGITPNLSIAGQLIIAVTMFVGRLGPLTLALVLVQRQRTTAYRYPKETVRIG
ncbi:TrkH family potassium uptake protein [Chloroflexota bacterium]